MASRISRRTDKPRSRKPRKPCDATKSPAIVAPFGARTRIPASAAAPLASIRSSAPMSARIRDAWGLRYSAHGLGRGKRARSTTSTSTPARASANATDEPAGPPPTTRTWAFVTHLAIASATKTANRPAQQIHHVVVEPRRPSDQCVWLHRSRASCVRWRSRMHRTSAGSGASRRGANRPTRRRCLRAPRGTRRTRHPSSHAIAATKAAPAHAAKLPISRNRARSSRGNDAPGDDGARCRAVERADLRRPRVRGRCGE